MDLGLWLLVWLLVACVALAAALGLWHDKTHRPGRERLLTTSPEDVFRARTMSDFYARNHGTEW